MTAEEKKDRKRGKGKMKRRDQLVKKQEGQEKEEEKTRT